MFNRRWVYKPEGNNFQGLIVNTQEEFDLLANQGYVDHHNPAIAKPLKEVTETIQPLKPASPVVKKRIRRTKAQIEADNKAKRKKK